MTDDLERGLPEPEPQRADIAGRVRRHHRRRMAVAGTAATLVLAAGAGGLLVSRSSGTEVVRSAAPGGPLAPSATTVPPPTTTTEAPPTSTTAAVTAGTVNDTPPPPPADATTINAPSRPPTCSGPEQQNVPTPDPATVRALVVGDWLLCDDVSFFGSSDENGLRIADDGHWAKVARIPGGELVEMDGRDNRGTWELIDTSSMNGPGHVQINFTSLAGGTRMSAVVIIAPSKLLLNNMGMFSAAYVPA